MKRECLTMLALSALTVRAVTVSVDVSKTKAEVPRTLYGTGMEDVNHEIYGGLDAQRLYDESFEESLPPQTIVHSKRGSGLKVCGRQWEAVLTGGGVERQDAQERHLGLVSQVLEPNGGTAGGMRRKRCRRVSRRKVPSRRRLVDGCRADETITHRVCKPLQTRCVTLRRLRTSPRSP